MLEAVSKLFHSGFPYIIVSLTFLIVTLYGLKLLRDIRDAVVGKNEDN